MRCIGTLMVSVFILLQESIPFGILRKFSTIIVLQVNDIEENLYKTKKKRELKRIVLKRKIWMMLLFFLKCMQNEYQKRYFLEPLFYLSEYFPFIFCEAENSSKVFSLNMPSRLSQDNKSIKLCSYFSSICIARRVFIQTKSLQVIL